MLCFYLQIIILGICGFIILIIIKSFGPLFYLVLLVLASCILICKEKQKKKKKRKNLSSEKHIVNIGHDHTCNNYVFVELYYIELYYGFFVPHFIIYHLETIDTFYNISENGTVLDRIFRLSYEFICCISFILLQKVTFSDNKKSSTKCAL